MSEESETVFKRGKYLEQKDNIWTVGYNQIAMHFVSKATFVYKFYFINCSILLLGSFSSVSFVLCALGGSAMIKEEKVKFRI